MGEGLAGMDRRLVHEFERDRDDARADDRIDAGAGDLVAAERRQHRPRALRRAQDAHRHLGDDRELALAAGEQAEPVIAGGIEMGAADLDHLALDGDDLQAEQVVGGDAVFQAMRAARVHADIAADHAGELARRVGRVEELLSPHRLGDAGIGDAGLHHGEAVGVVDLEDAVHPHHADHHGIGERQRAAGQAGAGAARDHPHPLLVQQAQDRGDLLGGFRQHDGERRLAIGGEPVGLVGAQPDRIGDHAGCRHERAQPRHDRVAAGDDIGFRRGLLDHRRPPGSIPPEGWCRRRLRTSGLERPGTELSALAGLHPRILLVDDVHAPVTPHHATVLVAGLGRAEGVADFHGTDSGRATGWAERGLIRNGPGTVKLGRAELTAAFEATVAAAPVDECPPRAHGGRSKRARHAQKRSPFFGEAIKPKVALSDESYRHPVNSLDRA